VDAEELATVDGVDAVDAGCVVTALVDGFVWVLSVPRSMRLTNPAVLLDCLLALVSSTFCPATVDGLTPVVEL